MFSKLQAASGAAAAAAILAFASPAGAAGVKVGDVVPLPPDVGKAE